MFEHQQIYHKIAYGDTLYSLAKKYNTTVPDILHANDRIDPYNLQIGSTIHIVPGHPIVPEPMHTPAQSNDMLSHNQPMHNNSSHSEDINHHSEPTNEHSEPHNNCISKTEFDLSKQMRLFWSQHVYWTRLLIISIVDELKDTDYATKRVLKTAPDIASLFTPYYGPQVTELLTKLLTEHLVVGKNLIVAAHEKNAANVEKYNREWYENADKIANAFSRVNPTYYNEEAVREMFYRHLDLTKEELSYRLSQNYAEDVEAFNKVEHEAMMMADFFVDGIVSQFPNRF
ncbi:MAG: LysM peptidoglycan-binding domain-containing protein [Oscillospiraceae bacterium]|nr:LysM peptidoglycan-binding domain-containing protein [Oscillospiraceae bacterium]